MLKKADAGYVYRCPYNNGLVREVRIEWPCPDCGADFGDEPVRCLDRKPSGPQMKGQSDE